MCRTSPSSRVERMFNAKSPLANKRLASTLCSTLPLTMTYKNMAELIDTAKANTNAHSDSNLGHKLGVSRSLIHVWRKGKKLPSEELMMKLAKRANLDVEEALILRVLWASHDETKSYYASILKKLAGCFPYIFALAFASQGNYAKAMNYNDNSVVHSSENLHNLNIMRWAGVFKTVAF